jgi:hypothetical protein
MIHGVCEIITLSLMACASRRPLPLRKRFKQPTGTFHGFVVAVATVDSCPLWHQSAGQTAALPQNGCPQFVCPTVHRPLGAMLLALRKI